jgi:uncharacterized membrane protein (DUF441 family)
MPLSDANKEKIKLRATFINGLAIGVVLIGVFTPIVRATYDSSVTADTFVFMAMSAAICFTLGFVLHSYAIDQLGELDR